MSKNEGHLPWLKFFPADHRSDPKLKMCSLAARGLWVEMLCLMNEAKEYGYLDMNGRTITNKQLALLVGAKEDEVSILINELKHHDVFSKNRKGVIYSRRMLRDAKKRKVAKNNGLKGGNPSLCKYKKKPFLDNPELKSGHKHKLKAQRPDTRDQSPEALVSSVTSEWKKNLLNKLGPEVFKSWIEKLEFDDGKIICPSKFFMNYITNNFLSDIQNSIGTNELEFVLKKSGNQ